MNFINRVALASLFAATANLAAAQTAEFVSNEVLVKFRGSTTVSASNALNANRAIGAQTLSVIPQLIVNRVRIPAGMSVDDALFYYGRMSTVEYVEPNSKKKKFYIPNDTRWAAQYGPVKVKAPEAWNITKGKTSVIIAIIDDGLALNHEEFQGGKVVPGFDFSDNDSDPTNDGDHGTHCAGIAAASTDNGKGVAGTGFNSRIMPLKIFPNATDAVSAAAIIHAANNGVKVLSMSYGSGFESTTERNAVNFAWSKGCVLLAAAGNAGNTVKGWPAAFPNVIAVGSTTSADLRYEGSTFGADWVDVGAPGVDIESTIPSGYAQFTGTSMACPMAAGVVALLWAQAAPGTTNLAIRNALETTTDPIANGGFAKGRINAFKAVQSVDPGSATLSNATSVSLWEGAEFTGSATDVQSSDGAFATVTSAPTTLGQVGAVSVDIAFNGSATNLRESNVLLEVNGISGSSGQVFLWNFSSQKFVSIRAFAIRPTGVKREKLALPLNLSPYVSGGTLRLGLKAIGPKRAPRDWAKGVFDFKVGFVQVSTRENIS
jgi:thermitase